MSTCEVCVYILHLDIDSFLFNAYPNRSFFGIEDSALSLLLHYPSPLNGGRFLTVYTNI